MGTLIHDLQHHAKDKYDLAAALALAFTTILHPQGWQVYHYGKGNNSWRLWHPETKEVWFFTGYTKGVIHARDAWRWSESNHHRIRSRVDALRFVQSLAKP